ITIWDSAPAALQRLVSFFPDSVPSSPLRLVMLSGDWIPVTLPDQIRQIFNHPKVMSMGGATEAAIWSNWYPIGAVDPAWPSIPYGTPIQNSRYYILDAHLRVVPVGVVGDLYIGGTCLASGYLKRPGLTAERFIDDPFRPGERLYKTGDLARYFDDGCMEFLGRADFQVKIRGYRVELGEIEAVLNSLAGIKESVCSAFEDSSGQKSLVAYVVQEQNVELDSNEVKVKVAKKVPDFMVPSLLVFMDKMPITTNGKVDRKALPDPTKQSQCDGFVAPRNDIEKSIAAVWEEVLGRSAIGIHDDFFDLGGHSLLAVMLVTKLSKELNEDIPLTMVLNHHTIAEQAESIASLSRHDSSESLLVPLNTHGNRPPIFLFTGAGGFAFVFHRLYAALPPDQPVYVLNAVGTREQDGGDNYTMEEMADIYEKEIEAVCDKGPIVLGGYSVGALLAFELANRFQKKKRDVKRIISFDGFAPQFPKLLPLPLRIAEHIHTLLTAKSDERWKYLCARWQNLKNRGLKLFGRDPEVADEEIVDEKMKAQINRIGAAFWEARSGYDPSYTVSCPLILFKCEIVEQWAGNKMDAPLYGWQAYITGPVIKIMLPGEHLQIFNDENVQLMTDELSRIQESDGPGGEVS
ncbi:MAG: AMP-binding protein, partial [Thioalkalispiraceae bacterium]